MSGCPERFPLASKSINQKIKLNQLFLNLSGWLAQKTKTHEWLRAGLWVDNGSIMSNSRVACVMNEVMFESPAQVRPFPETYWGDMKSNRHCTRPAFMNAQWKFFMSKRGFIVHEWIMKKHSERRSDEKMFMSGCGFVRTFMSGPGNVFFYEWRRPG